jgi:hypothetical protein
MVCSFGSGGDSVWLFSVVEEVSNRGDCAEGGVYSMEEQTSSSSSASAERGRSQPHFSPCDVVSSIRCVSNPMCSLVLF